MPRREVHATLLAALVVLSVVGAVTALGTAASPVAADQHTVDTAPDYTEEADFTVNFLYSTDHHPGDTNEENGSIQYFAVGAEAMHDVGAGDGAFLHYVVITADWIDYSACNVDNTAVFGFDRGNNNEGTQIDEDLVSQRKDDDFRDDGLTVEFYTHDDFGGDPPFGNPDDAIVAEQGARSAGGACLTVTDEPGWYQIQGFINGTVADNGPDEEPSDDADDIGIRAMSNYLYVCECDDEAEAREELGPPPSEDPEPTETPEPTPTATEGASTPTSTPADDDDAGPDPTPTPADDDGSTAPADTETATPAGEDPTDTPVGDDDGGAQVDGSGTPTPGDGPGFTGLAAVLALLASALLAKRRR